MYRNAVVVVIAVVAVASRSHTDGCDSGVVETEHVTLQALISRPFQFDSVAPGVLSVDGHNTDIRHGQTRLSVVRRQASDWLREVGRNAVQDALQLVGSGCVRSHFSEALAEKSMQDAEILADVDVVIEFGVALILGEWTGDLVEVLFHCRRLFLQKVIHKFHEILFPLEASKVGQRLQRLCN